MSSSQPSNFQSILNSALMDYSRSTGQDLATHPLASRIHSSTTPDSVLAILQEQARGFVEYRNTDQRLMSSLRPVVAGLYNISSMDIGPTTVSLSKFFIYLSLSYNAYLPDLYPCKVGLLCYGYCSSGAYLTLFSLTY